MAVMRMRRRRRKYLKEDLKETRSYWKLKVEALDRTQWVTYFGRGYGPVVRQSTEQMNSRYFRSSSAIFRAIILINIGVLLLAIVFFLLTWKK
jgi:hypothetical protein